ncbi:MAG: phosphoglycerate kinase [Candidatus Woesebacteria bacterium]|jgi:3-phosphoglycerate kinase
MLKLKILSPQDIQNKTVLLRADYNVPLKEKNGKIIISDDKRIQDSLETINFLLKSNAKIVIISHLGRPAGKAKKELSLKPIAKHLASLLKKSVKFIDDCIGDEVESQIKAAQNGEILLLENLRFYPEEKKNNQQFAKQLAKLADIYVNEAFSTSHRSHASFVAVTKYLPSYPGFVLKKEVEALSSLMTQPRRPFIIVIGGAKISDKVAAIEHLAKIADAVLVGGGVANNFLKAEGFDISKSYLQDAPADLKKQGVDYVEIAEELIEDTKQERLLKDNYIPLPKIIYPTDVLAARSVNSKKIVSIDLVDDHPHKNLMYLDIGKKTIRLFKELILQAQTIFWNGPMGVFENELFAKGTREIAKAIAKSSATTILGGGDTIAAIKKFKLEHRFDYVSAAGGSALEFLSGKMLPGIKPLIKKL